MPMNSAGGMGMQGNMMMPGRSGVGMQGNMNMQTTMVGASPFQQRTDNAFSGFGNFK